MEKSANTDEAVEMKCPRCSSKNVTVKFNGIGYEALTGGFHYQCGNCGHVFHNMGPDFETPIVPGVSTPSKIQVGRYGWECPKCGAVMSPDQVTCVNCRGEGWNKWTG